MHPRFAFALLLTVCAFGLGIAKPATPKCGLNAEYKVCGSVCAPTCARPKVVEKCPEFCVNGCFCKTGFLKNFQGECVRPQECGMPHLPIQKPMPVAAQSLEEPVRKPIIEPMPMMAQQQMASFDPMPGPIIEPMPVLASGVKPMEPMPCGKNEIFSQCKACDPTCLNPNPKCLRICLPGCQCKRGYVRVGENRCELRKNQCPVANFGMKSSSKDEEVHILPFPGPNEDIILPQAKPEGEIHILPMPDSDPKSGSNGEIHILPMPDSKIFHTMEVLPMCGENEVYTTCGPATRATCDTPKGSIHVEECVSGCFCKDGYLLNKLGMCVPTAQCGMTNVGVKSKPDDEVHILPFPGPNDNIILPLSEKEGEIHILPFPGSNKKVNVPKSGSDGEIHILPMPPMPDTNVFKTMEVLPMCKENEIYSTCGPAIRATCENPKRGTVHIEECVSGCFCKTGFLLDNFGMCVPAAQCTQISMKSETKDEVHILPFPGPNENIILPKSGADGEIHILPMPDLPEPNVRTSEEKCPTDRESYFPIMGAMIDCMNNCETNKDDWFPIPKIPKRCQNISDKPACVCNAPYSRNHEGRCVERKECERTNPISTTTTRRPTN